MTVMIVGIQLNILFITWWRWRSVIVLVLCCLIASHQATKYEVLVIVLLRRDFHLFFERELRHATLTSESVHRTSADGPAEVPRSGDLNHGLTSELSLTELFIRNYTDLLWVFTHPFSTTLQNVFETLGTDLYDLVHIGSSSCHSDPEAISRLSFSAGRVESLCSHGTCASLKVLECLTLFRESLRVDTDVFGVSSLRNIDATSTTNSNCICFIEATTNRNESVLTLHEQILAIICITTINGHAHITKVEQRRLINVVCKVSRVDDDEGHLFEVPTSPRRGNEAAYRVISLFKDTLLVDSLWVVLIWNTNDQDAILLFQLPVEYVCSLVLALVKHHEIELLRNKSLNRTIVPIDDTLSDIGCEIG